MQKVDMLIKPRRVALHSLCCSIISSTGYNETLWGEPLTKRSKTSNCVIAEANVPIGRMCKQVDLKHSEDNRCSRFWPKASVPRKRNAFFSRCCVQTCPEHFIRLRWTHIQQTNKAKQLYQQHQCCFSKYAQPAYHLPLTHDSSLIIAYWHRGV